MAPHPLSSAWAKYNWASQHMESVNRALARSLDPNVHPVAVDVDIEVDGNSGIAVAMVSGLPSIRDDCGLTLGDVFQNFRAALDHLAWTLVKLGDYPRPDNPRGVYFPMAKSGENFNNRINGWLPGVRPEYRAIIRRYQPYRRGEAPKAIRWLRDFSNKDKHRVLVPAVVNAASLNAAVESNWQLVRFEPLLKTRRALDVGTPLLKTTHIRGPATANLEVNVNGNLSVYPSLGRGVPVIDALLLIRRTVFEVLTEFDTRL